MRFLNAMTRADRRTFYRYFAPSARSALLMRDIKALRPPLRRCRLLPARVAGTINSFLERTSRGV